MKKQPDAGEFEDALRGRSTFLLLCSLVFLVAARFVWDLNGPHPLFGPLCLVIALASGVVALVLFVLSKPHRTGTGETALPPAVLDAARERFGAPPRPAGMDAARLAWDEFASPLGPGRGAPATRGPSRSATTQDASPYRRKPWSGLWLLLLIFLWCAGWIGYEMMRGGTPGKAVLGPARDVRFDPVHPQFYFNRALAHADRKEYDKAIDNYSEAIRLEPRFHVAYNNRGNAYVALNEYDKAIEDFSEAIRLDPTYAYAYNNRGIAYKGKKEYDKAIEDYCEAIRLDPTYASPYSNRGIAYSSKKEYDKAIKDYCAAIRLSPESHDAYTNLAWLLATCPKDSVRDGKKGIEHATTACTLSNWTDANDLENLAAAHAECGDFEQAVKWEKKAIERGIRKDETENARRRLKLYEEGKPYREDKE